MTAELEDHALHLGKLVGNLQSLEHLVRVYLSKRPGAKPPGVPRGVDIYEQPVGTVLDANALTNFDTLGQLVDRFNDEMALQDKREIDTGLIDLRDALAHGRVSAGEKDLVLRLVKFDKPDKQGKVRIVFNERMTVGWLQGQTRRVREAIELVHAEILAAAPRES